MKHTYRAVVRYEIEDDTWSDLPPSLRGSLAGRIVSEVGRDVRTGAAAGGLQDDEVHMSRVQLELDERGRRELSETLRELIVRADEIADESARRGEARRPSVLAVMHFRTSDA